MQYPRVIGWHLLFSVLVSDANSSGCPAAAAGCSARHSRVLLEGTDTFNSPLPSPDGKRLAYSLVGLSKLNNFATQMTTHEYAETPLIHKRHDLF
jgi:hypothetical protein